MVRGYWHAHLLTVVVLWELGRRYDLWLEGGLRLRLVPPDDVELLLRVIAVGLAVRVVDASVFEPL